jgi:hypothetical protein
MHATQIGQWKKRLMDELLMHLDNAVKSGYY